MKPERAAKILAMIGGLLLLVLFILRGYSLAAARLSDVLLDPQPESSSDGIPEGALLRNYRFGPGAEEVSFEQAAPGRSPRWYTLDLQGGPVREGLISQPDNSPFILENGQLFATYPGSRSSVVPQRLHVTSLAVGPDNATAAFSAIQGGGSTGIYTVRLDGGLSWLGDEENVSSLSWSPDGKWLAYAAPRDGVDQIIRLAASGADIRQLTYDSTRKDGIAWSPEGDWIAYLARTAEEDPAAVYLVDPNGQQPYLAVDSVEDAVQLSWVRSSGELAYVTRSDQQPDIAFLHVLNPHTGVIRRAYPYLAIEQLECPAEIPHGQEAQVRLTISNSSMLPASLPLVLRSGKQPFDPDDMLSEERRRRQAVRLETVDLQPGERRTIAWPVRGVSGAETYFSLLMDDDSAILFSQQNCSAPNTYLGLPDLPFLAVSLPLLIPGMLLVIPLILQVKKPWLWIFWLLVPLLLAGLVRLEISQLVP